MRLNFARQQKKERKKKWQIKQESLWGPGKKLGLEKMITNPLRDIFVETKEIYLHVLFCLSLSGAESMIGFLNTDSIPLRQNSSVKLKKPG